jgi:serine/threonine protein kinase
MTLSSSTRLGPYEILAPLGAGGMGEVYRARDTRLDRTVAIKVLPSHLSGNDEFRQRFEREARAVSSLNHPHICTLYDVGHQDGIDYLVMEFIEGESLADRLKKGALATEQTLRHAIEIADALDKAHRAGIVHRDLKPGNIMLTKTGAKLLDFGLAKLLGSDSAIASSLTSLPTERHAITGEGAILGTFQYMAPEQLEGKEADPRTDIFAFGAVVYEMATGKKAFTGKSQASLISSIMTSEPPAITSLQPMTPPALDRVVKKCLAKDPDDRWQSARDLMSELKWIAEGGSQGERTAPFVARRKSRERLAWIAAAVLLLGLLASLPFTIAHLRHAPVETQTSRFFVSPPEKSTLGTVTVSPDGRRLAFITRDAAGETQLWVRPLDSLAAQPLAGTDDASYPFWSPDSRFIGFFAGRKLKKVEVTGGPPSTLCNAPDGRGGAWNRDDIIIFAPHASSGLSRVSAAGGEPSPVTTFDSSRQEDSHRFPQFLPDDRHFLYFARSAQLENSAIYVGSLDQPQAKRIIDANTNVAYASPGYLLFQRERTLMAQAFDAASLELTGAPFRVAEQVGRGRFNNAYFSVSDTGVLVYQSGGTAKTHLVWVDRSGTQLGSPGPPGEYSFPALSPDEKRVAIARSDAQAGNGDIWLLDLAQGIPSRFTFDPADEMCPIWSPDGSRIVFASDRDGSLNLYQKLSSGAGSEEAILKSGDDKVPLDWSLDGRFILYTQFGPAQWDLWVLPLFGDRQPIPFLQTKLEWVFGVFSPDARWIAYQSDESGSYQVYVQSFPPSGGKWQISSEGGSWPRFRRDGKELFYLAASGKLMAVEVKANASGFEFSAPRPLFEAHTTDRYAVTADGQRFLINTPVEESSSAPITVVLNWTAEAKRQ